MDSYPGYIKSMEQTLEEVMGLLLEQETVDGFITERLRRLQARVGTMQFLTTERRQYYDDHKKAKRERAKAW